MNALFQGIFWCSFALVAYLYIGYPVLIWFLAKTKTRKPASKASHEEPASVLIVSYNDVDHLRRKVEALLATYPKEVVGELVIASDGSTDHTAEIMQSISDHRLKFVAFTDRRGKAAVLNELIPSCGHRIVILMDARQEVDRRAIPLLVNRFADDEVGVVSGELVFRDQGDRASSTSEGVGGYWKYEKFIRKCESQYHSVPGATGALYALRKDLFESIPAETLLDDVAIPMKIICRGHRCVFQEGAIIYDDPSQTAAQEMTRKRRTIAGNAQLVSLFPSWLMPLANPIWLQFVSHKMGRLLSPVALIFMITSCGLMSGDFRYFWLFILQILFYILALTGGLLNRSKLLGIFHTFLMLNWTTILAIFDAFRGRYRVTWDKAY